MADATVSNAMNRGVAPGVPGRRRKGDHVHAGSNVVAKQVTVTNTPAIPPSVRSPIVIAAADVASATTTNTANSTVTDRIAKPPARSAAMVARIAHATA